VLAFMGRSKMISAAFWAVAIAAMLAMRPTMLEDSPFQSGPISRS
jgi:hypothetical protein